MKKILAALTLVALIFTSCTETVTPVTVNLSKTTATELGLASSQSNMMFTVSNTTDNEATIQWEHAETASVTGWTYDVNGSSTASGVLTIPANGSVDITFKVMPNGTAGVGEGMLKFYDSEDQALTLQTFNYTLTTVSKYFEVTMVDNVFQSVRTSDPLETDFKMKVYNPNASDITVNWASSAGSSNTSNWILNVCDPATCFGPAIVDGDFPVPAGATVDFKFTFNHASTAGNGTAIANFFVASDSIGSSTDQLVTLQVN